MSFVTAFYHIVISTKFRKKVIPMQARSRLYSYINSILLKNKCVNYQINGIENHIHLLIQLHPSVALSSLVADIKRSSSRWMKQEPEYQYFEGWGKEYFAASVSYSNLNAVRLYITRQEEHHKTHTLENEMKLWAQLNDFEWEESWAT